MGYSCQFFYEVHYIAWIKQINIVGKIDNNISLKSSQTCLSMWTMRTGLNVGEVLTLGSTSGFQALHSTVWKLKCQQKVWTRSSQRVEGGRKEENGHFCRLPYGCQPFRRQSGQRTEVEMILGLRWTHFSSNSAGGSGGPQGVDLLYLSPAQEVIFFILQYHSYAPYLDTCYLLNEHFTNWR